MPGLEDFEGTAFHSAQWDHDHDLTGERVAVVGTGASAIQFVPRSSRRSGRLHVFQRTRRGSSRTATGRSSAGSERSTALFPPAQLAMRAGIYWARELFVLLFRHPPVNRLLEQLPLRHMRSQIEDPELRAEAHARATAWAASASSRPTSGIPRSRSRTWRSSPAAITEVRPHSVVAEDGTEREVDTIIFGTGFHVTDMPIADRVRGRDGRTLAETWNGSMRAYKGTTVAGYPNLFFLVGPNTGLGHTSIVFMIESQIEYVLDALRTMRAAASQRSRCARRPGGLQRRARPHDRGHRLGRGGCTSYYIDRNGHNSALWPTYTWPFRRRLREFDAAAYTLGTRERSAAEAVAA